jgi:hypothetical protein
MALRAWEHRKDRVGFTVDQVRYIADWRQTYQVNSMMRSAPPPEEERFFNAWFTRYAGEDAYGHPIIYDKVSDFDLDYLFSLPDEEVLRLHTKQMEVSKHVYLLDLNGLSLHKHFTARIKKMLIRVFKMEGTAYPDSLFALWIVNTPIAFKFVWAALAPTLDPTTKAKVRIVGRGMDEMNACGIPKEAIPIEFGGKCKGVTSWEKLNEHAGHGSNRSRSQVAM